jgi:hypothetical protein
MAFLKNEPSGNHCRRRKYVMKREAKKGSLKKNRKMCRMM